MAKREKKETPAVRPFWSGTLSFGLVSVPVNLYSAVRSQRPSLRMLDAKGTPLERRYYDPETGKTVANDKVARGYEVTAGEFVVVDDEELEAIAPEKTRDIDLRRFVPAEQLDPLLFETSYYLAPAGASTKAYNLLAATMEKTGRAGIATFVLRGVEHLAAIIAEKGILRAETLRFADEVRTAEDVGLGTPPKASAAEKKRFLAAVRKGAAAHLDESALEDEWAEQLEALVARKRKKGEDVVKAPAAEAEPSEDVQVIDLLEVLKKSMRQAKAGGAKAGGAKSAGGDALEKLSKEQLYERAQALDVPGRSSMSKAELLRAIRKAA